MSDRTLFLLEGEKTECRIIDRLNKVYPGNYFMYLPLQGNLYMFYKKIQDLGADSTTAADALREYFNEKGRPLDSSLLSFSYLYLVLDFDDQEKSYDEKEKRKMRKEMASLCSEEAGDFGKLLLDFPMVESYRDCPLWHPEAIFSTGKEVRKEDLWRYKEIVQKRGNTLDINRYKEKDFDEICKCSMKVAFGLLGKDYSFSAFSDSSFLPSVLEKEEDIFARNGVIVPLFEMLFFLPLLFGEAKSYVPD